MTAEWNNLVMLNYEVVPEVLKPYIPAGTTLDLYEGKALVSMVGFMFNNTSVLGVKWPFHINFEEVNLRFYVQYDDGVQVKRGAVFISEIAPKHIIAYVANALYKEHYRRMPMRHSFAIENANHTQYLYEWKLNGKWNKLSATADNKLTTIQPGSAEEFIFEHYWGYNPWSDTVTMEYQVEHPSWQIGKVRDYVFDADIAALYGDVFVPYLSAEPVSAFYARGSEIAVRIGDKLSFLPGGNK